MVNLGFKMKIEDQAIIHKCQIMKMLAISKMKKVGCVIEGIRFSGPTKPLDTEYFGGSNIEINSSNIYHAEMVALTDCIMSRYYPVRLFVTSTSVEEDTYLCGNCRQQILEVNKEIEIIVINPNGTIKGTKQLEELLPKHKDVEIKNEKFYKVLFGN